MSIGRSNNQRLLATKRFRRICFVVDRSALGHQAAGEFLSTKIVSGKAFADIFGLKKLEDVTPDSETKVHICTIQGLVKRVLYTADDSEAPPIDQYDLIVVDECHRGYLLDREMSDAELSFRGQDDYISKYRRVLEYFDAVKIGLTATPALHTTEIFGDPIFTYSYRDAVVEGHLIDHEPPIRIETALARAGIVFEKDVQLDLLNTRTGEINLAHAPDEIRFEVDQFNKKVVTPEFNRVVAEELAKQIDPTFGKTIEHSDGQLRLAGACRHRQQHGTTFCRKSLLYRLDGMLLIIAKWETKLEWQRLESVSSGVLVDFNKSRETLWRRPINESAAMVH